MAAHEITITDDMEVELDLPSGEGDGEVLPHFLGRLDISSPPIQPPSSSVSGQFKWPSDANPSARGGNKKPTLLIPSGGLSSSKTNPQGALATAKTCIYKPGTISIQVAPMLAAPGTHNSALPTATGTGTLRPCRPHHVPQAQLTSTSTHQQASDGQRIGLTGGIVD